ncbi:MAG TPA: SDR family oxidoreductase [Acidimicrobiales bacterium]|nr:SDR family oxidoreductase [Acidimicrobiales bacterium]
MQNPLDAYNLAGKVAVVTGAASGIGESAAEVYAACGASVVCADLNSAGAGATAQRISDGGGSALAMACNVTSRDHVRTLVDKAVAEFGHVDIMCNVAGAMFPALIEDLTDEVLDAGIALNLKGVIYGTQYAIKAMRDSGRGGSIINVSSGAIDLPYEGIGLYAFTKAAVAMLSMTAAKEVGRYGIRVNAIAPGSTMTAFTTWRLQNPDGSTNQEAFDTFIEQMKGMSPLGTVGEAIDQAQLMLYLGSDAGRWATGNIFRVNGGMTTQW